MRTKQLKGIYLTKDAAKKAFKQDPENGGEYKV
jgi:hypothetical protein